ncbi:aflatoxin B1 aldehyde reductase [Entomortierella parvispora]|uniref:Aflatoxin B1 aldehyde reductase n=1 Tax=Entomortierella parvispora TaxID=205924 RepID=A0A9P3H1G1_9FUNG|nr:aflatoxin B1 aldehyde reductase [Entomortierella parvispora]
MSSHTTPKIIFGTMTFGLETTDLKTSMVRVRGTENVRPFFEMFKSYGHTELDTARVYGNGETEQALGLLDLNGFKISTKVFPGKPHAHGENLKPTFYESLKALKTEKVDIFYLHAPDYTTPFEETIRLVDELYREGRFERFGLSNFAAWQVTLIHQLCKEKGYVLPTVYQGMYNAITRDVTRELFPCLKAFNIAFYAFNPIAGGLLSGKHKFEETDPEGRFNSQTGNGKIYRERYWNTLFFEAIDKLGKTAKSLDMTLLEASLRWMTHHSGLNAKDGIIIGASSMHHLEENLKELEKGPLPKEMVRAFDEAWEHVRVCCPTYFKDEASTKAIATANTK